MSGVGAVLAEVYSDQNCVNDSPVVGTHSTGAIGELRIPALYYGLRFHK